MSSSHFAKVPNITIPRSRFKMPFTHKTAWLHGYLVPIDCYEVLPGDTFNLKLSSLIRMSTPIAPIMDNIDCFLGAWFIPTRLLWTNYEKFMGANTGAGYQTSNPRFPLNAKLKNFHSDTNFANTLVRLSGFLGKPIYSSNGTNTPVDSNYVFAPSGKGWSVLKERGYYEIWNNYFRAEQLQASEVIDKSDGFTTGSPSYFVAKVFSSDSNDGSSTFKHELKRVNKKFDYFTAATIAPQYGPSVTLPLGQYAPIVSDGTTGHSTVNAIKWGNLTGGQITFTKGNLVSEDVTGEMQVDAGSSPSNTLVEVNTTNLVADLSQATAATINSLRYAFAVQRYLERSNYGCNNFFEILAVHYGVTNPDARLQRPEYLGGHRFRINVNQVLSNSGYAAGATTVLGETGAVSVTSDVCNLFTKAFGEPGYVYVMLWTKHDRTYSTMSLREDIKGNKFEFYSPEFANLGDMEVYGMEVSNYGLSSSAGATDNVFGYQEHWGEYRYRPDRVSSCLNPGLANALSYWTLADNYTSNPSLSESWIREDRTNLARCLKTGANGPDYIGDFYFDYTATREMPVYSVPGLIDHVGNM